MGRQILIILTAFLLFAQDFEVSAQYASVVECRPQLAALTRPTVPSTGPLILPTIIQPVQPGYDSYAPNQVAGYPNYGPPAPYQGYPPIIVKEDDNLLRTLLYLMIFEMGSRKGNYYNTPPSSCGCSSCSCGCNGSNRCNCSCNCPNCSKNNSKDNDSNNSAPTYIPVPIAIPVYTGPDGCRYIEGFDDVMIQDYNGQKCNCNMCGGKDQNEFCLIIKTE